MKKLTREQFKYNLTEACADKGQYISVEDMKKFLDLNYNEDSDLAEWGCREFADFADVLAEHYGVMSEACCEFDLKFDETYKVRVYDIDYDIKEDDIDDDLSVEYVRELLPTELELEVTCEEDFLEDEIAEAISDETGWLVNSFSYSILEQ